MKQTEGVLLKALKTFLLKAAPTLQGHRGAEAPPRALLAAQRRQEQGHGAFCLQ